MTLRRHGCREAQIRKATYLALTAAVCLAAFAPTSSAQTANAPENSAVGNASIPANPEEPPPPVVPAARPFGFTHNEMIDLSETFETNPLGLRGYYGAGKTRSDELTALAVSVGLHDHTLRFTGDLQYTFVGDAYTYYSAFDLVYNYLNALATAVVVPDYVILRASAFAAPILVNGLGPIAAPGLPVASGINTGMQNGYGYIINPEITFRLGNFARSDTVLNQGSFFLLRSSGPTVAQAAPIQGPPSQVISYSATERFTSGSDFNRLNWHLTGTALRISETGLGFDQESGTADFSYAVTREISPVATLGYSKFTATQSLNTNISGPILLGGMAINLGKRLQADFRAGVQFRRPSYIGSLFYQITPFTTFTASVTDSITTPAATVLGTLGDLGINNEGQFFNTNYQLGSNTPPPLISGVSSFNPTPVNGSAITNLIARYRVGTASLVHIADRTQYRLTAFWSVTDPLTASSTLQQTYTGGDFAIFRNINPFITGEIDANYFDERLLGGRFAMLSGTIGASYSLSAVLQVYARTAYIRRISSAALVAVSPLSGGTSDTAITVGARARF